MNGEIRWECWAGNFPTRYAPGTTGGCVSRASWSRSLKVDSVVALSVVIGASEWVVFGLTLLVGGAAALLPAWSGYRQFVTATLRE